MLDFELLRAFVAVADCGGFHRAAERLNLTQSTISQQIKRLEFETKRPLFRRTTRSVALTDDGEMLLGDARRLLQLEEAARHRLAAPRLSGTVRLGVVEEVAGGSLPSALGRFAALHPGVKLEVQLIHSISFPGRRCRWRFIANARYRARRRSTHCRTAISAGRSSTPARALRVCAQRRLRALPSRRFPPARSSRACAYLAAPRACRGFPTLSLHSTKSRAPTRPPQHSPPPC
jgi:hypothetical protein